MSGPTLQAPKKRSRAYRGILLKPIKFVPDIIRDGECYEPAADWPPDVADRWRAAVRECRQKDRIARIGRLTELEKRMGALQEHYGIDPEQPAWIRNLAMCLALAQEHEPELMADWNFAQVFKNYGMDPEMPGGESELALRIASKHVKGFQSPFQEVFEKYGIDSERPGGKLELALRNAMKDVKGFQRPFQEFCKKYRIDPERPGGELELDLRIAMIDSKVFRGEFQEVFEKYRLEPERRFGVMNSAHLAIADAIISQKLSVEGQKASVREVARIMKDPTELKQYMSATQAEKIGEVLRCNGNKEQGDHPRPLSCRRLRDYIGWMRSAWSSYISGEELSQDAKSFQVQFVEKVLPLLRRLSEE